MQLPFVSQYASHWSRNMPPTWIAIGLPFVSQHFWKILVVGVTGALPKIQYPLGAKPLGSWQGHIGNLRRVVRRWLGFLDMPLPNSRSHWACASPTPDTPRQTPSLEVVTPTEGSFGYQGVSTRGLGTHGNWHTQRWCLEELERLQSHHRSKRAISWAGTLNRHVALRWPKLSLKLSLSK